MVKFIYSKKATKFYKIFTLLLTGDTYDKSKVKILQNFVAFSEYMNFTNTLSLNNSALSISEWDMAFQFTVYLL